MTWDEEALLLQLLTTSHLIVEIGRLAETQGHDLRVKAFLGQVADAQQRLARDLPLPSVAAMEQRADTPAQVRARRQVQEAHGPAFDRASIDAVADQLQDAVTRAEALDASGAAERAGPFIARVLPVLREQLAGVRDLRRMLEQA